MCAFDDVFVKPICVVDRKKNLKRMLTLNSLFPYSGTRSINTWLHFRLSTKPGKIGS